MSKSKGKELLEKILKDLEKVAKKLDMHPSALRKASYYKAGGETSEWEFRKVGGFATIVKAHFDSFEGKDLGLITDVKQIRQANVRLEKDLGSQELFLSKLETAVQSMPQIKLPIYRVKKKQANEARTLTLNLSDLHFGSDITKAETGKIFGPVEEARAIAKVVENTIEYKRQYRDSTKLVINILGDVIENELHGRTSADLIHLQTCRAMWLLSQVVARCAENFPAVQVNMVSGNHGRDTAVHQQRATHMKYNSIETTIYYGVKLACARLSNVTFNQPMTPWVSYRSEGHLVYATHGDTHLNPGNPGNAVNVRSLENQINKINAALKDDQEYKIFIVGHVHQALVTQLPNGANLIINGALTPPNSFALTLNIMESQQIQVLFESTAKHPVGDFRLINLNDSANRPELDKLIVPFKGL